MRAPQPVVTGVLRGNGQLLRLILCCGNRVDFAFPCRLASAAVLSLDQDHRHGPPYSEQQLSATLGDDRACSADQAGWATSLSGRFAKPFCSPSWLPAVNIAAKIYS